MKKILWLFLLLSCVVLPGCSTAGNNSSDDKGVVGKYSRKVTHVTPDGKTHGKYTNTTVLKPDGTYYHSTDRGGQHRILETGTYKVNENAITFYPNTGKYAGKAETQPYDGRAIGEYFKRVKE